MLHIHGLEKSFNGLKVVDGISFDLIRGQVLGFLGPNGAGKSTTMRMLTGFLKPDAGEIIICDTDAIKNPTLAQSYIGYLPEGAPLYGDMTPLEYFKFMGNIRQMERQQIKDNIAKVVHDTMLEEVLMRPIETLSKGYKRRVGLAGALLSDPDVLILDEPTDGLDPNQKNHIRKLIKRLAEEKAIIISTHILEEVDAICTDTIVINHGKIVSQSTPQELIMQSQLYNAVSLIIETTYADEAYSVLSENNQIDRIKILGKMPKWTKMIIFPKNKSYILGEISSIVNYNSWVVAGIHSETGRLEEVFRRLTA